MNPYIGVTGFSRPEEVSAALRAFPSDSNRKLMVGVIATWKSLRGVPIKPKWAKQTPDPAAISSLFPNDERALNLVHFSTEQGHESSVLDDMLKIRELAGPNFHGFQLNIAWPDIWMLQIYRSTIGFKDRIVLQIGQDAVAMVGGAPRGVVEILYQYEDLVNDVLLDPSGGLGKPFDTERAREFLRAIRDMNCGFGLGAAGGLGPDSLNLVEPLVPEFPDLNIDAQGRVRNAENNLDQGFVNTYLTKASALFA